MTGGECLLCGRLTSVVSPRSETMSSSINWINSGNKYTHNNVVESIPAIVLRIVCVHSCKQCWYRPHIYAHSALKSRWQRWRINPSPVPEARDMLSDVQLSWAVQERLNRSNSQCALVGGHIAATWRIRLNHSYTAAMRLMSNNFDHLLSLDSPT